MGKTGRPVEHPMAKAVLTAAFALALLGTAAGARAEEFSLYGVRFGMTKAEVEAKWVTIGEDTYAVTGTPVRQVAAKFDHNRQLYEVTFTMDVRLPEPQSLVGTAFQDYVQAKWGSQRDLSVSTSVGTNAFSVTVLNTRMRDLYVKKIGEKIAPLFKP